MLLCHSFLIYLEPLHFDAGKYRIYVSRPPSSGVIFAFIYNIMLVFNDRGQLDIENPADFHHKLIEAFKVFKARMSCCNSFEPSFFIQTDFHWSIMISSSLLSCRSSVKVFVLCMFLHLVVIRYTVRRVMHNLCVIFYSSKWTVNAKV